jgi:aminoglycoside 3-N-acetyltransferase
MSICKLRLYNRGNVMPSLKIKDLETAFRDLGINPGDTVFVHSSLSSMGHVEGGAVAVVAALLGALGEQGTLAAPAFTFGGATTFERVGARSDMGQISEQVRTHPLARRSIHLQHSVSAVGPKAAEITCVHGASAWAADGPFWQLCALDAHILMLGVSYLTCTFFHLIEQLVQVPYRQWVYTDGSVREPDGTKRLLPTWTFTQGPGFQGNDFNKFGRFLEEKGLVQVKPVGNAIARLFKAADALHMGIEEYRKDPLLFAREGDDHTVLEGGVLVGREKYVVAPDVMFKS